MQNIAPISPDQQAPNYASRLNELLSQSGAPVGRPDGMIYSAAAAPQLPQQPTINQTPTPNPQIAIDPATIPTSQSFAAQAIASQPSMVPTAVPPRAPQQMTLSAAVQGAAAPSAPAVASTATMPGQTPLPNAAAMAGLPNAPTQMPMPTPAQPIPMPVQQTAPAPTSAQMPSPAPAPSQMPQAAASQMPAPNQMPAQPAAPAATPSPSQQAPTQPQTPVAAAPTPAPAAPAPAPAPQAPTAPQQAAPQQSAPQQANTQAQQQSIQPIADLSTNKNKVAPKNPLNTMSQEMIQQIVKATKVNTVLDDDEVVETIKPAYITELEQDLSADMHAGDGNQNKIAMQMSNELKDDELTIAASKIEQPKVVEAVQPEPEVELPEALKAALNDVSAENPNISFATDEEIAEKEAELAAEEAEKEAAAKDENNVNIVPDEEDENQTPKNTMGDGLGSTSPQMAAS